MNEQQNGQNTQTGDAGNTPAETKFCRECGAKISKKALICPQCGCATESYTAPQAQQPQVVINNSNQNQQNMQGMLGHKKNKWVAFWLCFFFGIFGAHKFYEGKVGMGHSLSADRRSFRHRHFHQLLAASLPQQSLLCLRRHPL